VSPFRLGFGFVRPIAATAPRRTAVEVPWPREGSWPSHASGEAYKAFRTEICGPRAEASGGDGDRSSPGTPNSSMRPVSASRRSSNAASSCRPRRALRDRRAVGRGRTTLHPRRARRRRAQLPCETRPRTHLGASGRSVVRWLSAQPMRRELVKRSGSGSPGTTARRFAWCNVRSTNSQAAAPVPSTDVSWVDVVQQRSTAARDQPRLSARRLSASRVC
jgi:hypothetical protein